MSEYRHFLEVDGSVYSTDDAEGRRLAHDLPEVKIVPLDAIVIDRADLPEVTTSKTENGYTVVRAGEWTFDHHPDDVPTVESAKAYLAAALWFEANPFVDEAQVKALSDLMSDIDPNPHGWYKADSPMLREMVKRGVRVEVSES